MAYVEINLDQDGIGILISDSFRKESPINIEEIKFSFDDRKISARVTAAVLRWPEFLDEEGVLVIRRLFEADIDTPNYFLFETELSPKIYNTLRNHGCDTLFDILKNQPEYYVGSHGSGLGKKSLENLINFLEEKFGIDESIWRNISSLAKEFGYKSDTPLPTNLEDSIRDHIIDSLKSET